MPYLATVLLQDIGQLAYGMLRLRYGQPVAGDDDHGARVRQQDRAVADTERFIERFRYKASKAKQVQSRVKALEKLERVALPEESRARMRLRLPAPIRAGDVVYVRSSLDDLTTIKASPMELIEVLTLQGEGREFERAVVAGDVGGDRT